MKKKDNYDVVQIIYDMVDSGEVAIIIRGNWNPVKEDRWETVAIHEFTSEEILRGGEYVIPANILHALEKELLKGAKLIEDDWRD